MQKGGITTSVESTSKACGFSSRLEEQDTKSSRLFDPALLKHSVEHPSIQNFVSFPSRAEPSVSCTFRPMLHCFGQKFDLEMLIRIRMLIAKD